MRLGEAPARRKQSPKGGEVPVAAFDRETQDDFVDDEVTAPGSVADAPKISEYTSRVFHEDQLSACPVINGRGDQSGSWPLNGKGREAKRL